MNRSEYHEEWLNIILKSKLEFVHEFIVKNILEQNQKYINETKKDKKHNNGIIGQIKDIDNVLAGKISLEKDKIVTYGETAYVFWLMGIKHRDKYFKTLQNRIDQFFKGTTYYELGQAGFRQFEYELHVMARFIEESIPFQDITEKKAPDLLVQYNNSEFTVEIKMPISNVYAQIKKAKKQFSHYSDDKGCIIIGLDYIIEKNIYNRRNTIRIIKNNIGNLINGTKHICFIEYWDKNLFTSDVSSVFDESKYDNEIYKIVYKALTGE